MTTSGIHSITVRDNFTTGLCAQQKLNEWYMVPRFRTTDVRACLATKRLKPFA